MPDAPPVISTFAFLKFISIVLDPSTTLGMTFAVSPIVLGMTVSGGKDRPIKMPTADSSRQCCVITELVVKSVILW